MIRHPFILLICTVAVSALAADAPKTVSPSNVLKQAEQKLGRGETWAPGGPNDGVDTPDSDRTLAPYFHITGDAAETEHLPLKQTSAEVQIAGVIAQVKVRQ